MGATREEIEAVYRGHYLGYRRGLAALTGSYESAHDIVQEAFVRAIDKRGQFRGEAPLGAWIWRIALRILFDERQKPKGVSFDDVPEHILADRLTELGKDLELSDAMRDLSPRQREMFFLRYFVDLSYQEIAAVCGTTKGAVGATISKARSSVEAALREPRLVSAEDTTG